MALNQKLEELLKANSKFQLKINQLEIQLNSVTNFLKQQFGNDFVLDNCYYLSTIDQPAELGPTTSSSAKHQQQQLSEKHKRRRRIGMANSNLSPIRRCRRTRSPPTAASSSSSAKLAGLDFVYEEPTQPINNSQNLDAQYQDLDIEDFNEQEDDHEEVIIKVELDPFLDDVEEFLPSGKDPLGDLPSSSGPSQQQGAATAAVANMSEKAFTCTWPQCTQQFSKRHDLTGHLRTHSGEKPFPCDWPGCKQRFAHNHMLIRHKRTHTGEKPYLCDWPACGQRFRQSNTLTIHKRIHTGEKPYACEWIGCGQRFRQHTGFKKHKRTHTGQPF